MADVLVAGDTLVIRDSQKVISVGDEGFVGGHGGSLQVGVTGDTAGIVYIGLAVGALGFPVDVLRVTKILNPQIVDSGARLGVHVIDGTIVG